MDGDAGYPSDEWEYIGSDINIFFIRLCQCNGAMYWRWQISNYGLKGGVEALRK